MAEDMDQREDLLQEQPLSLYLSHQPPPPAQQQLHHWVAGSEEETPGMTASASFPVFPSGAGSGCFSGETVAVASAPCSPATAAFSTAVSSRTRAPPASISPLSKSTQAKRTRGHRRAASDTTSLRDVNFAQFVKTESNSELSSLDNDQQRAFRSLQPTAEEKAHEMAMAGPSGSGRQSPPLCSTGGIDINDEVNELLSFGRQLAPMRKPAANTSGISIDELSHMDPKRAKRILANRQSAARSKERKLQYITELEGKVIKLQGELNALRREYKKLHSDTDRISNENKQLEQKLTSLEDNGKMQDAAYQSLSSQLSGLQEMQAPGMRHPSVMQPVPEETQQQMLWSNTQSVLSTTNQATPAASVGGGITIQLPNGNQIQIPQGSVVRTADGTLLISGGSQEGSSTPVPLQGLSIMGTGDQERHVACSGSQQLASGMVASASNNSLTDVTSRTVNRPLSPVALQGATLSPEGAPMSFHQQDEHVGGQTSHAAPTSTGNPSSTVGILSGQGSLREGILRLSSMDTFGGEPLDGLEIDDSWLRSLQEKSITDGNLLD